jgi:hypothetical protein
MPIKPDGQPDRNKQGLDILMAIPKWVDATISARKKHEKEMGQKQDRRARTWQESPRDQASHSLSSAIDQLGQLSLQGEPSPTDMPFPAPIPGIAEMHRSTSPKLSPPLLNSRHPATPPVLPRRLRLVIHYIVVSSTSR